MRYPVRSIRRARDGTFDGTSRHCSIVLIDGKPKVVSWPAGVKSLTAVGTGSIKGSRLRASEYKDDRNHLVHAKSDPDAVWPGCGDGQAEI